VTVLTYDRPPWPLAALHAHVSSALASLGLSEPEWPWYERLVEHLQHDLPDQVTPEAVRDVLVSYRTDAESGTTLCDLLKTNDDQLTALAASVSARLELDSKAGQ
jgi:hypothetical protein